MPVATNIGQIILRTLMQDLEYAKKYLPSLEPEYFRSVMGNELFEEIKRYIGAYEICPSREQLLIELHSRPGEPVLKDIDLLETIDSVAGEPVSGAWLEKQTEEFISEQHEEQGLMELVNTKIQKKPIKPLLEKLLNSPVIQKAEYVVSSSLDFISNMCEYFQEHPLVPFHKQAFNDMTGGGSRPGSFNAIIAGTGVGKSLVLVDMSGGFLLEGKHVAYFSGELSKEVVQARIISNITGLSVDDIKNRLISKDTLEAAWSHYGLTGIFVVDDFPTGRGNADMFQDRLRLFEQRNKFKPDVIIIDQLTNCLPCGSVSAERYARDERYGVIAQDFHRLAQKYNVPLWTSCQTNRAGQNGEVELVHMGDSHKISQDADTILSMWRMVSDELEVIADHVQVKSLKMREGGSDAPKVFKMDRPKMRLVDFDDIGPIKPLTDAEKVQQALVRKKKLVV